MPGSPSPDVPQSVKETGQKAPPIYVAPPEQYYSSPGVNPRAWGGSEYRAEYSYGGSKFAVALLVCALLMPPAATADTSSWELNYLNNGAEPAANHVDTTSWQLDYRVLFEPGVHRCGPCQ